ncbi:MAG: VWA domain-containing protein [Bacteroidota bacterium]
MKNLMIVVLAIILTGSCKKDENPAKFDYQMTDYDVQVTPAERQVSILFQVIDAEGIGVDQLTEYNFNVLENNSLVSSEAGIKIDPSLIPSKTRTVLLLDISGSVADFMAQLKKATIALINSQLSNQEFAIFTFDKDVSMIQDFTVDKALLISKINAIPETNLVNSTNLYGAMVDVTDGSFFEWIEYYSIDEIFSTNLVLFTDGRDNAGSGITLAQVIESIGEKKVYVAALQSTDLSVEPLKQIATQACIFAENTAQLEAKFVEVQGEIEKLANSLYYLYYTSTITNPASKENNLEVKIKYNTDRPENSIKTTFSSEGFNK